MSLLRSHRRWIVLALAGMLLAAVAVRWLPWRGKPLSKLVRSISGVPAAEDPLIQRLFGKKGMGNYQERMEAAHALMKRGQPADVAAFHAFLLDKKPPARMEYGQMMAIQSDIMNWLVDNDPDAARVQRTFGAILADKAYDVTTRDYVVQHLDRLDLRSSNSAEVESWLWAAAGEVDTSVGGTALLTLSRLVEAGRVDGEKVSARAIEMLRDKKTASVSIVSALQIAARHPQPGLADIARGFSAASNPIPVRLSAIVVLGKVGGADELRFLRDMAAASSYPVKNVVQKSCDQLQSRI